MRRDVLTGDWVNVVGHRQSRPNLPDDGCPFCVGGLEAPEPYDVRWFANRWPALAPGAADRLRRRRGRRDPVGAGGRRLRGRALLARARRVAREPPRRAGRARSSTSGPSAPRRCSPGPRSSTCSCSRTAGARSARRSTIRTGRSTATRSCRPRPRARLQRRRAAARCAARSRRARRRRARRRRSTATGWRGSRTRRATRTACGSRRARTSGRSPALDDAARDDLAALLVDALGRYDRLWPATDAGYPFPYLLWFHQAPAAAATTGTCTRTSRRRCARRACRATSRRASSAAARSRTRSCPRTRRAALRDA